MGESLLDYLRRPNPTVKYSQHKTGKSNTMNRMYQLPRWISKWKGFNTRSLEREYSEILGHVTKRDAVELREMDLWVRNEDGVREIISKWNREIVYKALEETSGILGRDDLVYMVSGSSARDPSGPTKCLHPDWAAIPRERPDQGLPHSMLPGDTKYSEKWKSEWVVEGERNLKPGKPYPEWFRPIAQIFTYCCRLEKRYAYIITDEELVLFRVGPRGDAPENSLRSLRLEVDELEKNGEIEFVSFPWANGHTKDGEEPGDPDGWSINTALWWIHLQAASNSSIEWRTLPTETDALPLSPIVHEVFSPRNDSCRSSEFSDQTEQASNADTVCYQEDLPLTSFTARQESFEPTVPEISAARNRASSKRTRTNRKRNVSSAPNTPSSSFVSHTSATSSQNKVGKPYKKSTRKNNRRVGAS